MRGLHDTMTIEGLSTHLHDRGNTRASSHSGKMTDIEALAQIGQHPRGLIHDRSMGLIDGDSTAQGHGVQIERHDATLREFGVLICTINL